MHAQMVTKATGKPPGITGAIEQGPARGFGAPGPIAIQCAALLLALLHGHRHRQELLLRHLLRHRRGRRGRAVRDRLREQVLF